MTKKVSSVFVCQQCGYQSPSFLGRCPNCDAWNSFVEQTTAGVRAERLGDRGKSTSLVTRAIKLSDVAVQKLQRTSTGISELDLVLGGGVVPGMVVLLSGEPGIGKSTMLLDLAKNFNKTATDVKDKTDTTGKKSAVSEMSVKSELSTVYVAGEESAVQIKIRAQRMGIATDKIIILEETDVDEIVAQINGLENVGLIIIDSVQTLTTSDLSGMAGTVGQVRECTARLISAFKNQGVPMFLVGHVTKEGTIAGPKVLEHAVDTILNLEGEKFTTLRLLRSQKNRFGPTDEVGVLQMTETGLTSVTDLEKLFVEESGGSAPGSCLTIMMEGTRPVLVEIQALVTSTPLPNPRRVASGVNLNRLLTVVAILQKRLGLPLYKEDIYVNVSGGLKIDEPSADLPMAIAIVSSFKDRALPAKTLALGELDLLGNVRRVQNLPRRVKEAKKLGMTTILSSETVKTIRDVKI